MRRGRASVAGGLLLLAACADAGPAATGLEGEMRRGPITPTCRPDAPCDAPLDAGFSVERLGRRIARFRSGPDGRFRVALAPGRYRIRPDPDAPLLAPEQQAHEIEVPEGEVLQVTLSWDTGLR